MPALDHNRAYTTAVSNFRCGRTAEVRDSPSDGPTLAITENRLRPFNVRSWIKTGRWDVRFRPQSQANQNPTSSHLAECNITRFTLHSDGEVSRAALGRSGVQIPPCCRDAAVPQGGLHEMHRGAPVERVARMGVA